MSDKFVLNVPFKQKPTKGDGTVRVDNVALFELDRLQRLTGLSLKYIATKAILYAAEHVEFNEEV